MQAIQQAIDAAGSPAHLATELSVSVKSVYLWRTGDRSVPVAKMADIERVTHGAVRRWHLRPEDWHKIWPELIGAEDAPAVPVHSPAVPAAQES
jgi:DNA-binding transcriptional regulator YdaS (Cro superfamily)